MRTAIFPKQIPLKFKLGPLLTLGLGRTLNKTQILHKNGKIDSGHSLEAFLLRLLASLFLGETAIYGDLAL